MREMEAAEALALRAREVGDNGCELCNGMSAVIPGWFSEISPMWPGRSQSQSFLYSFLVDFCCLSFVQDLI